MVTDIINDNGHTKCVFDNVKLISSERYGLGKDTCGTYYVSHYVIHETNEAIIAIADNFRNENVFEFVLWCQ